MGDGLKTAIVSINQLPATNNTLWLRLLGKGATQERAIQEILAFPQQNAQRTGVLELLVSWKITLEISHSGNEEERGVMMALSQAYLEWKQQTKQQGIEQGIQTERRTMLENLLQARFGAL